MSRGYLAKSSPSPNWSGLMKMLTTSRSHCCRAWRISIVCPSWNAPMVGTRAILRARL